jgi:hypothetical protein
MRFAGTHFIKSLQGLLGVRPTALAPVVNRIDDIRVAMLECLGAEGSRGFPQVKKRVMFASNVAALWYLRPELLMVIASKDGESVAQRQVDRISAMFDGYLPEAMKSRRASLGS